MSAYTGLLSGLGRAVRGWPLVMGIWVVTALAGLPLMLGVRDDLARQLGNSLQADDLSVRADYDWMAELGTRATGATTTLGPSVIGGAALADSLATFVEPRDLRTMPAIVAAMGGLYVLAWTFLTGGLIDRLARDRPVRLHGFFQVCGGHFPALFRLGMLSGIAYAVVLTRLHPWLFDTLYDKVTDQVTAERTAFAVWMGLAAALVLVLGGINLVVDFAKVRLVVEDRRSAVGALAAALRFVARNPAGSIGVYAGATLLFVVFSALAVWLSPGPLSWSNAIAAQALVIGRIWTKLVFWASETAWFQSRLAHAGWVAGPVRSWPESPVAEGVGGRLQV